MNGAPGFLGSAVVGGADDSAKFARFILPSLFRLTWTSSPCAFMLLIFALPAITSIPSTTSSREGKSTKGAAYLPCIAKFGIATLAVIVSTDGLPGAVLKVAVR